MSKKKTPFIGYTLEEVNEMERGYFCLVLGGDFVRDDNYYVFTKKEVSKLYKDTLRNLVDLIRDGNEKDKKFARDLIGGLTIKPMRLH